MSRQTETFAGKTAERHGWIVQPDQAFRQTVLNGLSHNRELLGYYLCPCREGWGSREQDRDIMCPCEYAAKDIREFGHCYCGLFCSPQSVQNGLETQSIPDRRPQSLYPD